MWKVMDEYIELTGINSNWGCYKNTWRSNSEKSVSKGISTKLIMDEEAGEIFL